mgnify:CR=1 FL=1
MTNQAAMVSAKGSDSATFDSAACNSRIYREHSRSGSIAYTWSVERTYEYIELGQLTGAAAVLKVDGRG